MPITIDIHPGGDRTALAMLVATVGLFLAACAQALVALRQTGAAKRQAEAAEKQSKAADRQLYETLASTDKASMPVVEIRRGPYLSTANLFRTVLKNDGLGPALHLQVLKSDGAVFVPGAPTKPIPPNLSPSEPPFEVDFPKDELSNGGFVVAYSSPQGSRVQRHFRLIGNEVVMDDATIVNPYDYLKPKDH